MSKPLNQLSASDFGLSKHLEQISSMRVSESTFQFFGECCLTGVSSEE